MNDENVTLCKNCGAKNLTHNLFCVNCGEKLVFKKSSIFSFTPKHKKPIIAGFLNLMLWGLGYYYLKINKVYMIPSFFFIILSIMSIIILPTDSPYSDIETGISLLFAADAYRRAIKQGDLIEK